MGWGEGYPSWLALDICFLKLLVLQFLIFMSFSLPGVVMVKCVDWTSSSREIALSAVRCSLVLMFENSLVFDVVTNLYELSCIVT